MSNQIQALNTEKVLGNFTQNELDTIKSTIAKGTTNEQFNLFTQICVNAGLNPFLNHVYCILYNGQMSVQIAVEGILYLARQKEGFKGIDAQLVHENDDFQIGSDNSRLFIKKHDIGFPRGRVIGGYAIAKREGFEDVINIMEVSEVEQFKKGRNGKMWTDFFSDMFKKHMMKRAAKLQFGVEINEDDNAQGHAEVPEYQPDRKEITPLEPQIVIEDDVEPMNEGDLMQEQWNIISAKLTEYKLTKKDLTNIIKEKFNVKPEALTLQQLVALTKFVDFAGKQPTTNEVDEMEEMFK